MAKVDFKLNDSLLRHREDQPARSAFPHRRGEELRGELVALAVPDAPDEGPSSAAWGDFAEARSDGEESTEKAPRRPRRVSSVQTAVRLPPALWDRFITLAHECRGLGSASQLLTDTLELRAPSGLEEVAADLERFLALPAELSGVGEPWEEHNLRLPVELRRKLDEQRRTLREAGMRTATRANLIAAVLVLRGPSTSEEARALMAERRAEALRQAIEDG